MKTFSPPATPASIKGANPKEALAFYQGQYNSLVDVINTKRKYGCDISEDVADKRSYQAAIEYIVKKFKNAL